MKKQPTLIEHAIGALAVLNFGGFIYNLMTCNVWAAVNLLAVVYCGWVFYVSVIRP